MVIPVSSDPPAVTSADPGINTPAGASPDSRITSAGQIQAEKKALMAALSRVFNDRLKGRVTGSGLRADPGIAKRADEIWNASTRPGNLTVSELESLVADANAIGYLADQITGVTTGQAPADPKSEFTMSAGRLALAQERYAAQLNLNYRDLVKERVFNRVRILHLDENPERAAIINEVLAPFFQKRILSPEEARRAIADVEKIGRLADFLNQRGVAAEYVSPEEAIKPGEGDSPVDTEMHRREYYLSTASLTAEDIRKAQSWEHLPPGTREITVQDAIRLGPPPAAAGLVDALLRKAGNRESSGDCLGFVKQAMRTVGLLNPRDDGRWGGAIDAPPRMEEIGFIRIVGITRENARLLPDGTFLFMPTSNKYGHVDVVVHRNDTVLGVSDHVCTRGPAAYARGPIVGFAAYTG